MNQLLLAVSLLTLFFTRIANADTFHAQAQFAQGLPAINLESGENYLAKIDLRRKFRSISRVCLKTFFQGDLIDPGEGLLIGPLGSRNYGWVNVSQLPIHSRVICLPSRSKVVEFLDGRHELWIKMTRGKAHLSHMDVEVFGF